MKKTGLELLIGLWILIGGMWTLGANAASVVYEDVGFIRGLGFESDAFTVSEDGNYRVTLTDFSFPASFDELNLTLTTYDSVVASISGSGWFDFEAKTGITYYSNVYGVAGGALDLGLYGVGVQALNAPVSSVPVPASLLLMSSALVALGAFGRGGSRPETDDSMTASPLPA